MSPANGKPGILPGCEVLPVMDADGKSRTSPSMPKKRGAAARFKILNSFVDFTAGDLSRSEILVWMVLYRDTKEGIARTSQADIARRSRLALRTVGLAVRRLERGGLVKVVHRGGLSQGPSSYRVVPVEGGQHRAQ